MDINIDVDKPVQKKWKPAGDWRFMLAMAIVLPFCGMLGEGNLLNQNIYAWIGRFLTSFVICGVVWSFSRSS